MQVLLFQLLSTMLCEALARVQRAAEILYLQVRMFYFKTFLYDVGKRKSKQRAPG